MLGKPIGTTLKAIRRKPLSGMHWVGVRFENGQHVAQYFLRNVYFSTLKAPVSATTWTVVANLLIAGRLQSSDL